MTLLFMLRHGPTAWNTDGRIQGRTDVPLSPDGRSRVNDWQVPLDWADGAEPRWFASPLVRARETAALLGARPALDPRLMEMRYGDWEGRRRADIDDEIRGSLSHWDGLGLDFRPPGGGESPRDVQTRLRSFLVERAVDQQPVIIVCHKGVIRALYSLATGWTMTVKPPHRLEDDCGHLFSLAIDGCPSVVRLNITLLTHPTPA